MVYQLCGGDATPRALYMHRALNMHAWHCILWLLVLVCEHELENYYYYCMLWLLVCAVAANTVYYGYWTLWLLLLYTTATVC
jgi:hypothetical protein